MVKPTLLVPAAGYGLRMGSPPAKELLNRPNSTKKFIDWPIEIALQNHWPITVISRKNKTALNDYLEQLKTQKQNLNLLNLVTIDASIDWFDTLLQTKEYWGERNIIFLPDVDFGPQSILTELNESLEIFEVAAAIHHVTDPQNWGHIFENCHNSECIDFFEKPKQPFKLQNRAWGLFGFRKKFGVSILKAQSESQKLQQAVSLKLKCRFIDLQYFSDLTR